MSLAFTGTSGPMTTMQKTVLEDNIRGLRYFYAFFSHGDCVSADAFAHAVALDAGYKIIIHPPLNTAKRAYCQGAVAWRAPKPYLERNKNIIDESRRLIAAPNTMTEVIRSGTWSTIRYAEKKGMHINIILPDGSIVYR